MVVKNIEKAKKIPDISHGVTPIFKRNKVKNSFINLVKSEWLKFVFKDKSLISTANYLSWVF